MQRISSLIQWHEGMFLGPQHFQQLQRRIEDLGSLHNTLLHTYGWGISHLKIDPVALGDSVFQIHEIIAIMPDNTLVHYPDESGHFPLKLDLKPHQNQAESASLRVYLCIPEMTPQRSSVVGEWPRYHSIEGDKIMDENLPESTQIIPRLHPKLSLMISDAAPSRYTAFPIAEVVFRESRFFLTDFTPPHLSFTPHHPIHERIMGLTARMRDKALYLSEKWEKQLGTTLIHETANQLRPLVKVLPLLEGTLRSQSIPPYTLYQLLCVVLGELSTMRLTVIPPLCPVYDHYHCKRAFDFVLTHIETLIENIEQTIIMLPFNQKDRVFFLKIHESYITRQLYLGIRAPSNMTESMLFDWMNDAVIASDSTVESARKRRISGASRYRLDHEEMSDFLVGRGTLVFKLPYPSEFIQPGEHLNIFNAADDTDKRPLSVVLYLKPSTPKISHAA